ncbi:hypothetical protein BU26DRAFT_63647 [Trematosphaeria pertusa]|uniref:Uncharacterized protein n=1 Tax=Trematosphaeria pertusa TaxID=390896 RepID=A0A6A6I7V8_9PLEO|nr:uncharacterized protein BU26DRAFT_63647 [Trematosphaeria pertusa]KAF2246168.1 hypothetical protein BU26DRAFT_63647 [Trematosphaeria pertusa]
MSFSNHIGTRGTPGHREQSPPEDEVDWSDGEIACDAPSTATTSTPAQNQLKTLSKPVPGTNLSPQNPPKPSTPPQTESARIQTLHSRMMELTEERDQARQDAEHHKQQATTNYQNWVDSSAGLQARIATLESQNAQLQQRNGELQERNKVLLEQKQQMELAMQQQRDHEGLPY